MQYLHSDLVSTILSPKTKPEGKGRKGFVSNAKEHRSGEEEGKRTTFTTDQVPGPEFLHQLNVLVLTIRTDESHVEVCSEFGFLLGFGGICSEGERGR